MDAGRSDGAERTRRRILDAAGDLLAGGGRDAVSTRAVCAAAGVQAPTLYRLFGDKQGLLDAVAAHRLAAYVEGKARQQPAADPVEDLRDGWDQHVAFGLANPDLYALMYADARRGAPAVAQALEVLATKVRRVAEAGRLRVGEEHAARLLHAAGRGTTLSLAGTPPQERDPALSTAAREAVVAAITTEAPAARAPGPAGAAAHLRALLPQTSALSEAEAALLREWLDRVVDAPGAGAGAGAGARERAGSADLA